MNDNQKTYETGKPCPYCGGEMLDGGYVGAYCGKPDFYQEPDHFTDVSKKVKIVTEIDLSETITTHQEAKCKEALLEAFEAGKTSYKNEILDRAQVTLQKDRDKFPASILIIEFYRAFGWQGGTIHQIMAEIKRLQEIEKAGKYASEKLAHEALTPEERAMLGGVEC